MLLGRILGQAGLEHDPAVEINIGGFHRYRERQGKVIFIRLVHSIGTVARPLIVGNDLACDHIRLAGIGLKGIDVILDRLQVILYRLDGLRGYIIHFLFQAQGIIRIVQEFRAGQQVGFDGAHGREIGIADIVLNGDLPFELAVIEDLPGGSLLFRYDIWIVDDPGHAPHVAGGVFAPGLPANGLGIEDSLNIRGNADGVIIIGIGCIVKVV